MSDNELPKQVLEVIPTAMLFMRGAVKQLQKGELKFPHYRLIAYVNRQGKCSNCELAEWQGVSVATMSRTVDTMIAWGLLNRTVNSRNRREVTLNLTPKGKKVHEEMRQRLGEFLSERLNPISNEDKQHLAKGLKVLALIFA